MLKDARGMKGKRSSGTKEIRVSVNEQVRAEIEVFLFALESYADRFAKHPGLSFDEHCASLMAFAHAAPSALRSEGARQN
jgi:hypothetical protein